MSLIDPADTLERQNEKLLQIADSLMRRVEAQYDETGLAYDQFERAALLEAEVRQRTTELERALDLLHESNARLAGANARAAEAHGNLTDAIETIRDGFALFGTDDRLVLANSRFCRDFSDVTDHLAPGLAFNAYIQMVSQSSYLQLPEGESSEQWARTRLRHHAQDHAVLNLRLIRDRWLQVSEHRTSSGGTVIVQTDITDLKREERDARHALIDRQARIVRATLDHLNQGVCIFDGEQRLAGSNAKAFDLLGLRAQDRVTGFPFAQFLSCIAVGHRFARGFTAEQLANWAAAPGRRAPVAFELRADDQGLILSVFAQEMPDQGFVISFTDVTAERHAAQALFQMNERLERRVEERTLELEDALFRAEQANTSKTQFVAAASHDLMQPLSAAKLFIGSLGDQTQDPNLQALASKAEGALVGAQHIIETLLDISQLESGVAPLDFSDIALGEILDPLVDEFEPMATQKGITLRVVSSALWVRSNAFYLRRILQNLIGNAVRYTQTGRILVGVRRYGGSARIEVWDTGPGIQEADQKFIFQAFKQASDGRHAGQGVGLGLAIVERASTALGHPLDLWSRPGVGSCFSLNVPFGEGPSTLPETTQDPPPEFAVAMRDVLALLVENDDQLARAITTMIENWGGHVIHISSAEEALALLPELDVVPDALLLDYQLGGPLTGLDLWRDLRARYGPVPVRILSANRTRELREACAEAGAPLLTKPLDRTALAQFLASCQGG